MVSNVEEYEMRILTDDRCAMILFMTSLMLAEWVKVPVFKALLFKFIIKRSLRNTPCNRPGLRF